MTTRPERPLGEVLRDGDRRGLRFVRELPHPPERVWRAITEPDDLRHWMPCDIVGERRVGAEIELPFWPAHAERYHLDGPAPTGRITAWEPPTTFGWIWGEDDVRFELAPAGSGTLLTLTTWLGDPDRAANTAGGFHVCLGNLEELLDTGGARPLVDPAVEAETHRLEAAYAVLARG